MDSRDFIAPSTGRLVKSALGCDAFIPAPLPPHLDLAPLVSQIAHASSALGELSGIGRTLADPHLLIRPFVRREAVASSRIEGTVTSLSQLFLFEADEQAAAPPPDAREVLNYVRALEEALAGLAVLPISTRLLRQAHARLLRGVTRDRGAAIVPGEFRTDQNWIGARLIVNARYVPPPHLDAVEAMSDLEKYINLPDDDTPLVVRLALVHYQFEAIHPFADGNGRVGRLLIALMLHASGQLSQPLLYMSTYFERHNDAYVDAMLSVSTKGEWTAWVAFFLSGVEQVARDVIAVSRRLQDLRTDYLGRVRQVRSSGLLPEIIDRLFASPAVQVPALASDLGISPGAVRNHLARLATVGIVRETTYGWPRIWLAQQIVDTVGGESPPV